MIATTIFQSRSRGHHIALACVATALSLLALPAMAQTAEAPEAWPSKPIRIVLPFAAGGGTDVVGRLLAQGLEPLLGQPVIIDNRNGAAGGIGAQLVAKSPPDGYTVLHGTIGTHAVNQFLYPSLPFDPVKEFVPVTLLTKTHCALAVGADAPYKTLQELIQYAEQNPGKLNYGIPVNGDACHMGIEMLKFQSKINIIGIPYNSVPTAMTDLLGGRLQLSSAAVQNVMPLTGPGKLRALAVLGDTRSEAMPNVPNIAESGFPGFAANGWQGYFFPTGTSPIIVNKLAAAIAKLYAQPAFIAKAKAMGLDMASLPPDQFNTFVVNERAKWSAVIKMANIKPQ